MKVGINQNRTFYNLSHMNTSIHRHFRHIIFEDQLIKSWWLPTCHVTGWIVDNICLFFFIPYKSSSCSNLLHIKSPNMPYKYDCMIADLHRVSHFSAKSYKNNRSAFSWDAWFVFCSSRSVKQQSVALRQNIMSQKVSALTSSCCVLRGKLWLIIL